MRASLACLSILFLALPFGCRAPEASTLSQPALSVSPSGLGSADLVLGTGPFPRLGQTCVIEAQGWVEENGRKGRLILDTRKRGFPATFPVGVGRVIQGWEEGLATMKKGGKRLLRVPPALGYSPAEAGGDIPKGATLLFELELMDIR
ncbi:MAG: FKBP-type peptidyl-prolyl cis-trans isomerase [Geothrix sp.]|nr:FKBP-type peptidyl-prolyl cis-trans isomerase [Geothrix sp.]